MKRHVVAMALRSLAVGTTAFLLAVLPARAGAQGFDEPPDRSQNAVCTTAILPGSMAPVAVYSGVYASLGINEYHPVHAAAAALNQAIARRVRALLGGTLDSLPRGEPTVTWQGADGSLRITAHRDGRMTWRTNDTGSVAPFNAGVSLLARALSIARDSGATFAWPAEATGDSVVFNIGLYTPTFTRDGDVSRPSVEGPVALFSVMQPWFEPPRMTRTVHPRYPAFSKSAGAVARLDLKFVVDTAGRVDRSTIADMRAYTHARLTGALAKHYDAFLRAITKALEASRFEPARIGGCPIRQLMIQSFEFRLG